ncbi:ferritin [Desulfobaculum senezii]|jgi:ferritin|uniref:ferritin n=1 Tax=Desulfobaculum sp. SPO524 TaxID=3378071 RepID=UPI0038543E42
MLSEKMEKALNAQIKWEFYSSYLYLSMSSYFADKGLPGFSHWMRTQAQEELFHATKFYDYVLERGGKVELQSIDQPPSKWDDTLDVFKETLKHEQHVTKLINELVDTAISEKDHACNIFLQWFVEEQVEEEDSVNNVLDRLKLMGKEGSGLFMLDQELGKRVFTPPTTAQ